MIPVARCGEPSTFDASVRQVGMRWLREKLGGAREHRPGRPVKQVETLRASELEPFWTLALPDLRAAYHSTCAYAGIEIMESGHSVDHFIPKGECVADEAQHHRIYDWDNYRYAFSRINAAKGEKRVLDPFEIGHHWFALEFVALRVVPREGITPSDREKVIVTIRDLDLNSRWLCELRCHYFDDWNAGELSIAYLRRHAPFVAGEIDRLKLVPEYVGGLR